MFRHTTKQDVRSQEWLRKRATKALEGDRQILCDSVYDNTYARPLPHTSVDILNNMIVPLTGCESMASVEARAVFTVVVFEYPGSMRLRITFVQPEISTATCNAKSVHGSSMNYARSRILNSYNNPSPGRIAMSREKCQIAGRLAPYIVEESGLSEFVSWSYCNASKSRFMYTMTGPNTVQLMSLTKDTISIYQGFCADDCAIVYVPTTRCFKITTSPDIGDDSENPNKSTCIFLYCDGTFKVLGTPQKAYKVCKLFRDTLIRAHTSPMHSRILNTLVVAEDAGAQGHE